MRRLSNEDRARVIAPLRALELAAISGPERKDVEVDLFRWETMLRAGYLECAEVPRMAEAFRRYGVA